MDQTKINETIKSLCEKYKDDSFMISKTEHLICHQLPVLLQNIEKTHAMQVQRITELNAEQDAFIQGFLASNIYFYAPITENFFYYDGVNYVNVTEDEILHKVLSTRQIRHIMLVVLLLVHMLTLLLVQLMRPSYKQILMLQMLV